MHYTTKLITERR